MRRTASPLIVSTSPMEVAVLHRQDLKTRQGGGYDERWVQELVHYCPSILPIAEVEPAFWPAVPVCMELPLTSGFLDNLLVTPLGDLIAVECKLWRNSEARREVIAQVIDYAKDLQSLDYEALQNSIRRVRKEPQFDLYQQASAAADEPEPPLDEASFVDAVSRNLRRGRCLLVIVGDGITEGVESMTEFLQQHAGLHFAIVLVQLGIYEIRGTDQRVVVPSIPMRTTNITRGVVQVESERVTVAPPKDTTRAEKPTTLSEEELFAALDRIIPGTSDRLVKFLSGFADLQIHWEVRKTLIVRMIVGTYRVLPFVVNPDGTIDTGYTHGLKDLCRGYAERMAIAIPETVLRETEKTCYVKKANGSFLTVWELLDNEAGVRSALENLNAALHSADQAGEER
ncbi:hypothetical protein DBT53_000605, partial [Aerococcus mictus]|uniref:hypothetical protein n=1 Tax=Aerococcus mictus TaxID=2976810 RepID=UPI002FD50582